MWPWIVTNSGKTADDRIGICYVYHVVILIFLIRNHGGILLSLLYNLITQHVIYLLLWE